jgi:hypothetical protein
MLGDAVGAVVQNERPRRLELEPLVEDVCCLALGSPDVVLMPLTEHVVCMERVVPNTSRISRRTSSRPAVWRPSIQTVRASGANSAAAAPASRCSMAATRRSIGDCVGVVMPRALDAIHPFTHGVIVVRAQGWAAAPLR